MEDAGPEDDEPMMTLLKLGAWLDPPNFTMYTQLMIAVIGSDELDVSALLYDGVDVNEKNERSRDALTYAASARHEEVVRPLLEAGADIHSRDADGMTALCVACEGGNGKIAKMLLENGADISAEDRYGRTPISIAAERGHESLARRLRRYGTDGHWEDEVEPNDGLRLDESNFHEVVEFYRRDHELGSPGYKYVESLRRRALRWGYDKTVPARMDEYMKKKAREQKSASGEEQEQDPDLVAQANEHRVILEQRGGKMDHQELR